jgi:hypothetical protein
MCLATLAAVPSSAAARFAVLVAALGGCSLWLDADEFEGADGDAPDGEGSAADAAPAADAATKPDAGPAADAAAEPDAAPDPVDAAGAYTVSITSGANECGFGGWQEGASTSDVPLTVTQQDGAVTATVDGGAGLFLDLVLGSRVFQGQVSGAALELTLFGTKPFMSGACTFTVNGVVSAEVVGDTIAGQIQYRPSTNGSPDCGALEQCSNRQDVSGARPPAP